MAQPGKPFITGAPSIVVACDVGELEQLAPILAASGEGRIGALKIGFSLGERYGIPRVVEFIRERSNLLIIYDKQKAGTDIPDTAREFARVVTKVDAAILFPMAGPATERAYIEALQEVGVRPLVGAVMTHPQYLEQDGGYIAASAPRRIIELALELGVRDFIVPATHPKAIEEQRALIEQRLAPGEYDVYAPGLIAQGGSVEELRVAAGPRWHAIVGRAIYGAKDPKAAIEALGRTL